MDDNPTVFVVGTVLFFVAAIGSCSIGVTSTTHDWQTECVKRKVAHWEISASGTTKFVWDAEASEQDKE